MSEAVGYLQSQYVPLYKEGSFHVFVDDGSRCDINFQLSNIVLFILLYQIKKHIFQGTPISTLCNM